MKIADIVAGVNELLAGERHSFAQLKRHLDRTIDDINTQLASKFPAFSELDPSADTYDYFPDRFIRMVVWPGAAWYYFVADEEGNQTSPQYQYDYDRGLFVMTRDFFNQVPEEYQSTDTTPLKEEGSFADGEGGIFVHGYNLIP